MIYTNFKLPSDVNSKKNVELMNFSSAGLTFTLDLLKRRQTLSALLFANPTTKFLIYLGFMRVFRVIKCPIFLFDLILKRPNSFTERFVAKLKGVFIRFMDYIFVIHKDTSGYQSFYGLKKNQFIYVPFKANNFDTRGDFLVSEGDYVVALGASQRDYKTLIDAAKHTDLKIVIVCSDENAVGNNAILGDVNSYPANVNRIRENVDSKTWYGLLAQSKFVVIPILSSAIQPAGISVYLEAMILKKAVVVSQGASTNFILENNRHAILVPPDDPKALALALNRMGGDESLRKSIENSGYEYALSLGNDAKLRENILKLILSKVSI
jgi:glycosyltransferase involved in cell wall biosynthesis